MSRRKKKPHNFRGKNAPKPVPTEAQIDERVVREVATTYTCSSQMTHDFVHQIDENIGDLAFDIDHTRLALEMWRDRPGHVEKVAGALADLRAVRERYFADLATIRNRLADLMAVPHDEHLHPVEDWLPLVRKHVIDGTVEPPDTGAPLDRPTPHAHETT